jgi:type II secretory pathway pseudopilin PulG
MPAVEGRMGKGARRRYRRRASAFTVAEILIALAIIAVLAAVAVPTIMGRVNSARADSIIAEMQSLQNGIMLFYKDVGHYPRRLDYLNTLAVGDLDACGQALSAVAVGRYRGPYINRPIQLINPPSNTKYTTQAGDSVESVLTRTNITTTTGTLRVLQILVNGVDANTSNDIDIKVDGRAGIDHGIIHIAGSIVKWSIPIRSTAC